MYSNCFSTSEVFCAKSQISYAQDRSFQLDASPEFSHHQNEPESRESSLPCSPGSPLVHNPTRHDLTAHDIEKQLLCDRNIDEDDLSAVSGKKLLSLKKITRPNGNQLFKYKDIKHHLKRKLKTEKVSQDSGRFAYCPESGKQHIRKHVTKLRLFWKGSSLNYPFIFKKLYAASTDNETAGFHRIYQEDLSNKLIHFTEY